MEHWPPTRQPMVGAALANRVADRLEAGEPLMYVHRDYCGMGLAAVKGLYIYDACYDSWAPGAEPLWGSTEERKVFDSRAAFVQWLAVQTDESLSGNHLEDAFLRGNQRLTRQRLREFCGQRSLR